MSGHRISCAYATPVHDRVTDALETAIFPALSARMKNPAWLRVIRSDPEMNGLAERRRKRIADNASCMPAPGCVIEGWKITDDEQREVAERLDALFPAPKDGYRGVQWRRDARAINTILSVYGQGVAPRYPKIDAMSLDRNSVTFGRLIAGVQLRTVSGDGAEEAVERAVFGDAIGYATFLLDANDRDDAVRFPDLWENWNAPALKAARHLRWDRAPFAAIVVPGEGPEAPGVALSAPGKFRVMLAAEAYGRGLAPFVIVTGGAVHPSQTPYVEAQEMRRALIERYGLPQSRVVMEPYARHTTTNLRNAARILHVLGAPSGKPSVIVTDQAQSASIASGAFAERNQRELGCQPGRIGRRLSPFALEFVPTMACAAADPADPLDP